MFKYSKRASAAVGAAVIGSFGLIALAPAANAGTVTPDVTCVAPAPVGTKTGPMPLTVTDKTGGSPYVPGGTVSLEIDPGTSPVGSPFPLQNVDIVSTYTFTLSGAATGDVSFQTSSHYDTLPTGGIDGAAFTATFTVPLTATPGGTIGLTWKNLVNNTSTGGTSLGDVPCTPGAGNGVVQNIAVKNVPPPPAITSISPTHALLPAQVAIAAKNFTPGAQASLVGLDAAMAPTGDIQPVTVAADGTVNGTITVTKPNTVSIAVSEGAPPANNAIVGFRVDTPPPPGPNQTPSGEVKPGEFKVTQTASGVSLTPITINGKPQTMTGKLNQVAIVDFRGSTAGWDVTATASDFVSDTGGVISKDRFKWTPSCAKTNAESPSTPVAGTPGTVDKAKLCSQAANGPGQVSGGEFSGDANLTLDVPSFQLAGVYTSTVTLSLS